MLLSAYLDKLPLRKDMLILLLGRVTIMYEPRSRRQRQRVGNSKQRSYESDINCDLVIASHIMNQHNNVNMSSSSLN